jgi:hypothetical protein
VKQRKVQNSFLTGVIDPRASGRVGTEAYQNGLLIGRNVIPVHLGGVRRRPGMRYVDRLSFQLGYGTPAAVTAPNGGTTANAYDDDNATIVTTTTPIGTTNPYVVVRYDMGAAFAPRHVDIHRISITLATSQQFVLQYSTDDVAWTTVEDSDFLVDTTERTYRFTPLDGTDQISARYWRVARVGAVDLSTAVCSLAGFDLWAESDDVSEVKLFRFELGVDDEYLIALTDRSAFIYQDGELVPGGYLPMPYTSADVATIDADTGADTLFLTHEAHPPRYLLKSLSGATGHNDFQSDEVEFSFVPKHDFNDSSSPVPVSAVQVITFSAGWIRGDTFQVELDGARTGAIAYAGDSTAAEQTATAANIEREIQKLYSVPGFDGVTCARTGALAYTVTLAGSSAKAYGLMTVIPLITEGTATATGTVTSSATGSSRHENAWSAVRLYPSTTAFFENRWYFGGTVSLPKTWYGSAINNITYFDIDQALDSDPLSGTFDGNHSIVGLFAGRSLQIFTTNGEFRYIKQPGEAITPSDVPRKQTEYGAKKIRPVSIDGSTLFVQRNGKSVRDFKFDINEDSYTSMSLSSLAPHLLNNVVDITAWNGSRTDEINLVFVVNGDGTMAVLNVRREAEVMAWTQWITGKDAEVAADGTVSGHDEIKAACALTEDIYFATTRTINGVEVLYLEIADEDMLMDASVLKYYDDLVNQYVVFAADDPLLGTACRVTIDGLTVDSITPAVGNNLVTIAESYPIDGNTEVRVGLNFTTAVTPMPLVATGPSGDHFIGKARIVKVKLKVRNTLGLLVNGHPIPDRRFNIDSFDAPLSPVTGNVTIEESTNWDETEDKLVNITQVDPMPMEILGLEVVMEGS